MTGSDIKNSIYSIDAGKAFAAELAAGIIRETEGQPEALTKYRIMLPTRRGCRHLRDAFLRLTDGKPLLLPRLMTIGDVEEDELLLDMSGNDQAAHLLDMPPAIDPLRRQILMARLVEAHPDFAHTPDHALKLAKALGQLIDQIYNENLDMADLTSLVPENFADHWQITLQFLQILSQSWPEILAEEGAIDAADRRNRLIHLLADHWEASPPQSPVIAAGSTGSMPATARLLGVVAGLPQGRVVLPGLDREIDEESWQTLDDMHPQATLRNLLNGFDITRQDVRPWNSGNFSSADKQDSAFLAREMMRPAATADAWHALPAHKDKIKRSLDHIKLYECDTQEQEAGVIALLMRETLEDPEKTAALVTPDRILAKRVMAACARWGIAVDDSAGTMFKETPIGVFLLSSVNTVIEEFRPAALLSFLRHPFVKMDMPNVQRMSLINKLEIDVLRGPSPRPGFEGLRARIKERTEKIEAPDKLLAFLEQLETAFQNFMRYRDGRHGFQDILKAHITLLESLADRKTMSGAELLWRGDAGETATQFLSSLLEQRAMPDCTLAEYTAILEHFMAGMTVRSPYGVHPRLYIYGQLEARIVSADRVIMGSLNEGTWPPNPSVDPWMSRPMRTDFGLPSYERSVGLSAHDFVLGLCADDVIITRAKRVDGAPSIPARWLQRLDTVMQAAGIDPQNIRSGPALSYQRYLNDCAQSMFIERPQPKPPVADRPDSLSVTAIETWMRDPYALYARYILKLRKLDPLEDEADAALRGTIIHKALETFVKQHPDALPDDALDQLRAIGETLMQEHIQDEQLYAFWQPRFENLARWFVAHDENWRRQARNILTESKGAATLDNGFTLRATADRIDRLADGGIAVIDYKTGNVPSVTDTLNGFSPQMPLEGLLVTKGGFEGIDGERPAYLGFWKMTGGQTAGEEKALKIDDFAAFMDETEAGFKGLIDTFKDGNVPYYSLPRPDKAPPAAWQDYAHLARVQEWVALDDSTEDAA